MRKGLYLIVTAGLLWLFLGPQFRSLETMGVRRFHALAKPGKELVVGVCWPFALNQDGLADGLVLARDEINREKGAGAWPLRLVMRDPGFDGDRNRSIAMDFANTPGMSAVLGYYEDSAAIKASVLYESSRLLHIMIGVNSNAMTQHGFQYLVRTIVNNGNIAQSLARVSLERGYKKIAIVWEEDAFGVDLAYNYRVAMDGKGVDLLYQSSYPLDRADFRTCVNELKEVDADIIFFAGLEPLAGDFLRMARSVGLRTPVLGAFSDTPVMRERAGPGLEGAMFFDFYDPHNTAPENQAFVQAFQARFGRMPDAMAAQGYDALHLLANAAKATHSRNPLDLSYAIRFTDPWQGANGLYRFDVTGELKDKPIYLKVFHNGVAETLAESRLPVQQPPK